MRQIKNFLKPTILASHRGISPSRKLSGLYFAPPGIAKRQFRPPPRGGEFGNPEVEPSGNYLD